MGSGWSRGVDSPDTGVDVTGFHPDSCSSCSVPEPITNVMMGLTVRIDLGNRIFRYN